MSNDLVWLSALVFQSRIYNKLLFPKLINVG